MNEVLNFKDLIKKSLLEINFANALNSIDNKHKVIDEISQLDGVKSCIMVAYNGDYVS
jgi:hypothetical protein